MKCTYIDSSWAHFGLWRIILLWLCNASNFTVSIIGTVIFSSSFLFFSVNYHFSKCSFLSLLNSDCLLKTNFEKESAFFFMQKNPLSCHHCDKAISDWVLYNCRRSRKYFSVFIFQFLREDFELIEPKVMHLCNSGTHSIYYRWLSFGLVSWQPTGLLCCTTGCAGMQFCRFSNSYFGPIPWI